MAESVKVKDDKLKDIIINCSALMFQMGQKARKGKRCDYQSKQDILGEMVHSFPFSTFEFYSSPVPSSPHPSPLSRDESELVDG